MRSHLSLLSSARSSRRRGGSAIKVNSFMIIIPCGLLAWASLLLSVQLTRKMYHVNETTDNSRSVDCFKDGYGSTKRSLVRGSSSSAASSSLSSSLPDRPSSTVDVYEAAKVEDYMIQHLVEWGWDKWDRAHRGKIQGCRPWREPTFSDIYQDLQTYYKELNDFFNATLHFQPISDLMTRIRETTSQQEVNQICKSARVHPQGIPALFPSGQLSLGSSYGYIEPLLTPMRHPNHCFWADPMNMTYLVHDFEAMCQTLKPYSRRILLDIGASLKVHSIEKWDKVERKIQPIEDLIHWYNKFGFDFDHIFAFEATPIKPSEVFYDLLPQKYMNKYHWINVGVNATKGSRLNPWDSIVRKFTRDDFIVVKLDIDTSSIELPLAQQLLNDTVLQELVDQFYFEHHVVLAEMGPWWTNTQEGSVKDSMDLFRGLRDKGVAAHFWV